MRTKRPVVWEGGINGVSTLDLDGGIHVDTTPWFAWLDAATTTSFAYPIYNAAHGYIEAFMTVRKERRRRGGAYWTVYWHVGGRLRKVYVGRSATVTGARLRAIAAALLASTQHLETGSHPIVSCPQGHRECPHQLVPETCHGGAV